MMSLLNIFITIAMTLSGAPTETQAADGSNETTVETSQAAADGIVLPGGFGRGRTTRN